MTTSTGDGTVSYERDIKPLFRDRDRESMLSHFDLWSYHDVRANADAIYKALDQGVMPCDGAWPPENVGLMRRWIDGGLKP
jgi:hypothetical protein